MFVDITDTPKLEQENVETWVFGVASEQRPLGKNIPGASFYTTWWI